MFLVTGGAGFIGSNVARRLAARGSDVVVCDWFGTDDKWKNIRDAAIREFVFPEDLAGWLKRLSRPLSGVVHMGAISATTERDVDLIIRRNVQFSDMLWDWCAHSGTPYIYASSAATYGDGSNGFVDRTDDAYLAALRPLNAYGWSKHVFDRRVMAAVRANAIQPPKWAGLKFFNVYGPREDHKGSMRSVPRSNYDALLADQPLRLFKSDRPDYRDGEQTRDFVYVDDCVDVIEWMLANPFPSDVYNVGAGKARTWVDLGRAMFKSLNRPESIEFIEMPANLKGRYQYRTEADISKLRAAGYAREMTPIETGIELYFKHLATESALG